MKKTINKAVLIGFFLLFISSASLLEAAPLRSFSELFPGFSNAQRRRAFSEEGLRNTFFAGETPFFIPASNSGIDLYSVVMEKTPTILIEALMMVPYNGRPLNKVDTYNVIGRIEDISKHRVFSSSQGRSIPIFTESTRLDNGSRNRPIPDPPPATVLPFSESIFFRLNDAFFGNTYLRGDFSNTPHGISFNITNNRAIWFLIFPVMRAEKFVTVLYLEPLKEGTLVYGMVGLDVPQFLIERMNLATNIDRRLTVFMNWLSIGLELTR